MFGRTSILPPRLRPANPRTPVAPRKITDDHEGDSSMQPRTCIFAFTLGAPTMSFGVAAMAASRFRHKHGEVPPDTFRA
jgi:hypothetical protein